MRGTYLSDSSQKAFRAKAVGPGRLFIDVSMERHRGHLGGVHGDRLVGVLVRAVVPRFHVTERQQFAPGREQPQLVHLTRPGERLEIRTLEALKKKKREIPMRWLSE